MTAFTGFKTRQAAVAARRRQQRSLVNITAGNLRGNPGGVAEIQEIGYSGTRSNVVTNNGMNEVYQIRVPSSFDSGVSSPATFAFDADTTNAVFRGAAFGEPSSSTSDYWTNPLAGFGEFNPTNITADDGTSAPMNTYWSVTNATGDLTVFWDGTRVFSQRYGTQAAAEAVTQVNGTDGNTYFRNPVTTADSLSVAVGSVWSFRRTGFADLSIPATPFNAGSAPSGGSNASEALNQMADAAIALYTSPSTWTKSAVITIPEVTGVFPSLTINMVSGFTFPATANASINQWFSLFYTGGNAVDWAGITVPVGATTEQFIDLLVAQGTVTGGLPRGFAGRPRFRVTKLSATSFTVTQVIGTQSVGVQAIVPYDGSQGGVIDWISSVTDNSGQGATFARATGTALPAIFSNDINELLGNADEATSGRVAVEEMMAINLNTGQTTDTTGSLTLVRNSGTNITAVLDSGFQDGVMATSFTGMASTYTVTDYNADNVAINEMTTFNSSVSSATESDIASVNAVIVGALNRNIESPIDVRGEDNTDRDVLVFTGQSPGPLGGLIVVTENHHGVAEAVRGNIAFEQAVITRQGVPNNFAAVLTITGGGLTTPFIYTTAPSATFTQINTALDEHIASDPAVTIATTTEGRVMTATAFQFYPRVELTVTNAEVNTLVTDVRTLEIGDS